MILIWRFFRYYRKTQRVRHNALKYAMFGQRIAIFGRPYTARYKVVILK